MGYEVDYATAEAKGGSSKLTIDNSILYLIMYHSLIQGSKYYVGPPEQ